MSGVVYHETMHVLHHPHCMYALQPWMCVRTTHYHATWYTLPAGSVTYHICDGVYVPPDMDIMDLMDPGYHVLGYIPVTSYHLRIMHELHVPAWCICVTSMPLVLHTCNAMVHAMDAYPCGCYPWTSIVMAYHTPGYGGTITYGVWWIHGT